jgi:streptogramin lyase
MHIGRQKIRESVFVLAAVCLLAAPAMAHPGSGIAVDKNGQVYFLDTGSGLFKIDAHGKLTKLSSTRFHWLALDSNNAFANTRLPSGPNGDIEKVGTNPTVLISSDWPIAVGRNNTLYFPSRDRLQIKQLSPSGVTSVFATLPAATAKSSEPHLNGLTVSSDGSVYYTDDSSIRRITAKGVISTVATVPALAGGPAIPGVEANSRPYLRGLEVDATGIMYVAASGDGRVLKITPEGKVTTLIQTQSPWSPTSVALFGNDAYVLEFLHTARDVRTDWLPRVRKISPDGTSKIIATIERVPAADSKPK